jgi:hypothetical protein
VFTSNGSALRDEACEPSGAHLKEEMKGAIINSLEYAHARGSTP